MYFLKKSKKSINLTPLNKRNYLYMPFFPWAMSPIWQPCAVSNVGCVISQSLGTSSIFMVVARLSYSIFLFRFASLTAIDYVFWILEVISGFLDSRFPVMFSAGAISVWWNHMVMVMSLEWQFLLCQWYQPYSCQQIRIFESQEHKCCTGAPGKSASGVHLSWTRPNTEWNLDLVFLHSVKFGFVHS